MAGGIPQSSSVQPSSIAQYLLKEERREKPQFTHTLVSISHWLTWSSQGTNLKDNCGPRHVAPGITFGNWSEFDEDKDLMSDWTEVGGWLVPQRQDAASSPGWVHTAAPRAASPRRSPLSTCFHISCFPLPHPNPRGIAWLKSPMFFRQTARC